MTLEFTRECIIVAGAPILGTIDVRVEIQDGLRFLYVAAFEPETPLPDLLWAAVKAPCDEWLVDNYKRVQKSARAEQKTLRNE